MTTTTLQGFDGILFQKKQEIIELFKTRYIQLIQNNNEETWSWKTINIPKNMNLDNPNIVTTVYNEIRRIVIKNPEYLVGLFLFQLKHPEIDKITINEDSLKELLIERIISDIDANARQSYNDFYQEKWFASKTVPASYIAEGKTIDDLLGECWEEYQDSDEKTEDYIQATEHIKNKWLEYTNNHRIIINTIYSIEESGVIT